MIKLLVKFGDESREVEFDVSIFDPKERTYQPLNRVSPVVDALAKTQFDDYVKRVRVFGNPDIARELSELPTFCEELVRALAE